MNNWFHDAGYELNADNQYYKDYFLNNELVRKITVIVVQTEFAATILEVDENSITTTVKNTSYNNINEIINNYELL